MIDYKHKDFALRLQQACDGNPLVPNLHHGRLTWFKNALEVRHGVIVTTETVRKWFSGETRPKPKAVGALAEILRQDVAWLATGSSSVVSESQSKTRSVMANGGTNVVAGLIQLAGFSVAFPTDSDSRAKVKDISAFAIIKGRQIEFHVTVEEVIEGVKVFRVPADSSGLTIIGLAQSSATTCEFYKLDWSDILTCTKRAGAFEVPMSKKGARIESFATL